ncbi:hypothetical protein KC957_03275, partial [Candidatus Saccharibacteria bacterium]|nr:hypothetical protein [Candidatus Saccharibacteria bacterium]
RCFRETGIILPEFGQTYVRKHDRGNLTEIEPKGHKTVHRNPGVVGKVRAHRSGRTTPKGTRPRVIPSKRKAS